MPQTMQGLLDEATMDIDTSEPTDDDVNGDTSPPARATAWHSVLTSPAFGVLATALEAIKMDSSNMPGEGAGLFAARASLAASTLYTADAAKLLVGDDGLLPVYNKEHRKNLPAGEISATSAVGYARVTAEGGVTLFSSLDGIRLDRISKHWTVLLFPVCLLMMLTFGAADSPEAQAGGGKWAHTLSIVAAYLRGPGSLLAKALDVESVEFLIFDSASLVHSPFYLRDARGLLASWVPVAERSVRLIERVLTAPQLAGTSMLMATRPFATFFKMQLAPRTSSLELHQVAPGEAFEDVETGRLNMYEVRRRLGQQEGIVGFLADSYHPSAGTPSRALAMRNNLVLSFIFGGSPSGVLAADAIVPPVVKQLVNSANFNKIVERIAEAMEQVPLEDLEKLAFAVRGEGGARLRSMLAKKGVAQEVADLAVMTIVSLSSMGSVNFVAVLAALGTDHAGRVQQLKLAFSEPQKVWVRDPRQPGIPVDVNMLLKRVLLGSDFTAAEARVSDYTERELARLARRVGEKLLSHVSARLAHGGQAAALGGSLAEAGLRLLQRPDLVDDCDFRDSVGALVLAGVGKGQTGLAVGRAASIAARIHRAATGGADISSSSDY